MEYYIYGAGKNLEKVLNRLDGLIEIKAIMDNDEKKVGKRVGKIEIIPVSEYLRYQNSKCDKNKCKVIVSVTNPLVKSEIVSFLNENNCDYIMASSFCNFCDEQTPGMLTGVRNIPNRYKARPSFDPDSYLMTDTLTNRLFRVYKNDKKEEILKILQVCEKNNLLGTYIVDSWVNNIEDMDDCFVIEHRYLRPISFCYEWAPGMYEDYVYYMLDFVRKLTLANLGLIDSHGLNATFIDGKFLFYDFGAICRKMTSPMEMLTLIDMLVLPLLLIKLGEIKKAYFYLEDHNIILNIKDVRGYLTNDELYELKKLYIRLIFCDSRERLLSNIDEIEQFIRKFRNKSIKGDWENYQDSEWLKSEDQNLWSEKMRNVYFMIETIQPKTIIDIAGNQGWYGACYRDKLEYAIITDMDIKALDKLWMRIKKEKFTNIIPIKMSICAPSLGRHFDGFIDGKTIRTIRKSGKERFNVELAIALAIIHHLAFRECLSFDEIVSLLDSYTERYLIVEYVDINDKYIQYFKKDGFDWYTRENFEMALCKHFSIMKILDSSPAETRKIYLCEKL